MPKPMSPSPTETTPLECYPSPEMSVSEDRPEIAFFDVETIVPTRLGQGHALLEFGAILVCPRKLEEIRTYSTLIRPANPSLITSLSLRRNGITPEAVVSAPRFTDIACRVYDILHGRIWAGHNIVRFDIARIREAFKEVGRDPPEPKGIIDTLPLLTHRFGRRAGDMKMASLAKYFGLGNQVHRSLEDVRMNIEIVKHCATVILLESSLPEIFTEYSWVSPNVTTRSRGSGKSSPDGTEQRLNTCFPSSRNGSIPFPSLEDVKTEESGQDVSPRSSNASEEDPLPVPFVSAQPNAFDMGALGNEIINILKVSNVNMEQKPLPDSPKTRDNVSEDSSDDAAFLALDEVSISSIRASLLPFFRGTQKLRLLHNNAILQLRCPNLRIRFGISGKFVDHAGRPRLNFVVDTSPNLCKVLDACDDIARKVAEESGSVSVGWRSTVYRKHNFHPTVRLHIPAAVNGEVVGYGTEIYQKQTSGAMEKLCLSKFDASELDGLIQPGTLVEACFSVDTYVYQQSGGIRLVAQKLFINNL